VQISSTGETFAQYLSSFLFQALDMDFDFRLLIVVAPVAVAAGWAVFNILPAALKQIQVLLSDKD
jgi:photosystem II PsbY protein